MATLSQLTQVLSLDGGRRGKTLVGIDVGGLVSQFAGSATESKGHPDPRSVRVKAHGAVLLAVEGTFGAPPVIGAGPHIELADGDELEVNLEGAIPGSVRGVYTQAALGVSVDLFVEEAP